MCFGGYTQMLCINGHYHEVLFTTQKPEVCPYCGRQFVWENIVDWVTGGGDCGKVELQCLSPKQEMWNDFLQAKIIYPAICLIPNQPPHLQPSERDPNRTLGTIQNIIDDRLK